MVTPEMTIKGSDAVELVNVLAEFSIPYEGKNILVAVTSAELDGADKPNYTLSLKDAPTCTANIFVATSVNNPSEFSFTIFPNPFSDFILLADGPENANVTLTNLAGSVAGKCRWKNDHKYKQLTARYVPDDNRKRNAEKQTYKLVKR